MVSGVHDNTTRKGFKYTGDFKGKVLAAVCLETAVKIDCLGRTKITGNIDLAIRLSLTTDVNGRACCCCINSNHFFSLSITSGQLGQTKQGRIHGTTLQYGKIIPTGKKQVTVAETNRQV